MIDIDGTMDSDGEDSDQAKQIKELMQAVTNVMDNDKAVTDVLHKYQY